MIIKHDPLYKTLVSVVTIGQMGATQNVFELGHSANGMTVDKFEFINGGVVIYYYKDSKRGVTAYFGSPVQYTRTEIKPTLAK